MVQLRYAGEGRHQRIELSLHQTVEERHRGQLLVPFLLQPLDDGRGEQLGDPGHTASFPHPLRSSWSAPAGGAIDARPGRLRHSDPLLEGKDGTVESHAGASANGKGTPPRYDAFISYSHESDGELAPILQSGVEKFAKPWHRLRALRLFRDETNLSFEPALWPSIVAAMSQSSWFVLLASPRAAASEYVDREVKWWVDNRNPDRLMIVVTGGQVRWDDGQKDFDWEFSNALPASLRDAFEQEPRWLEAPIGQESEQLSNVNPQLQEAIVNVAATLRGVDKDQLVATASRERRRTRRLVRSVAAALAALLVGMIAATVFALIQRSDAITQARVATARQLAAVSESELASNLDIALLLAVKAYREDPSPQTLSALMQADLYSPQLAQFLPMGGTVASLAGSADGSTVVAELGDGRVVRRVLGQSDPTEIGALGGDPIDQDQVTSQVGVSANGRTVVATNGSTAMLWRAGSGTAPLRCSSGQPATSVSISSTGQTAIVNCQSPAGGAPERVEVVSGTSGDVTAIHTLVPASPFIPQLLNSDSTLFVLSQSGRWQWRRLSDWSLEGASTGSIGFNQGWLAVSPDGRFVTATNGDPKVPVWPTDRPTGYASGSEPFEAQVPTSQTTALALSVGGTALAAAESGTVYVSPVTKANAPAQSPLSLPGNGSINERALNFVGDANHLLSATADTVARWDLTQPDRLGRARATALTVPCMECSGALAAISPDGSKIAILNNTTDQLLIQNLDGAAPPQSVAAATNGMPVWDGNQLLVSPTGSASRPPSDVKILPPVKDAGPIIAMALSPDRKRLILVDQRGDILVQDLGDGAIVKRIRGPRNFTFASGSTYDWAPAIDAVAGLVALDRNGTVTVVDVNSGRTIAPDVAAGAEFVAYAASSLLVQASGGNLEVWNARGSSLERVIPGDESYSSLLPIPDPTGQLVARQRSDGTVVLVDLKSGTALATIPSPLPASDGPKLGLAFSPDGSHLVTIVQSLTFNSSEIIDRDFSTQTLIHSACSTAGRSLTASDWRTYVGGTAPSDLACG